MPDFQSAIINGLGLKSNGLTLLLECRNCSFVFEKTQLLVVGLALCKHECPQCRVGIAISPDDLITAFTLFFPHTDPEEAVQLNREAGRFVQRWYRSELIAGLLYHKGINLGEPCEQELLDLVVFGFCMNKVPGVE